VTGVQEAKVFSNLVETGAKFHLKRRSLNDEFE
jgi:hypothetical protein